VTAQARSERTRTVRMIVWVQHRVTAAIDKIAHLFSVVAGLVLCGLMLLIVSDVSGRYFFNSPLPGTIGIAEILMCVAVFFGLAQTHLRGGNIQVEILTSRMRPAARRLTRVVSNMAVAVLTFFLVRAAIPSATRSRAIGEVRYGVFDVPVWPGRAAVAIGGFVLLLVTLRLLLSPENHHTDDRSDR
jgi:TRAP-type C4-dicarboxylate transport system permease small subunit